MESSSEGFLAANRNFSQATRDIESIQAGHEATTRRRSEDIISAYQALRPQGQAAFRAGYVEPLIARRGGHRFPVPARSAGYWKARFSEWANLGPLLLRTQLIVLHGVRSTSFVGAFGPRFSAKADSKPPTQRAAMAQQIRLSAPRNISSLKLRDPPALNIVAPSSCRKNVRMRTI